MFSYISDLVHAARTLVKARAFTAVCVTSLGLGMGVVILILLFTRTLLSTAPGVDDDGLVELVIRPSGQLLAEAGTSIIDTWSYPDYLDVRDTASGMVITGWSRGDGHFRPADQDPTISLSTMYVSSNYFSTIGVTLPLGRGFTPVDDASRAEPEAVISHRMWQVRFESDPNIIGRAIAINQTEYVVVGAAPEGFRGHVGGLDESYSQLWLPLSRHPRLHPNAHSPRVGDPGLTATQNARFDREADWLRVVARLSPAATVALRGDERQTYTVIGVTADLVSTQMGNPRAQLFISLAQHPASSVLVIARGAAADPSVRRAFENATADGLRQIAGQALRQSSGQADPDSVLRDFITGEWLIENSRSDLLTQSGVGGVQPIVAIRSE